MLYSRSGASALVERLADEQHEDPAVTARNGRTNSTPSGWSSTIPLPRDREIIVHGDIPKTHGSFHADGEVGPMICSSTSRSERFAHRRGCGHARFGDQMRGDVDGELYRTRKVHCEEYCRSSRPRARPR